ncbi:MAG: iron-containing alcohol dehydrogenase [Nitrospirota bacterium]
MSRAAVFFIHTVTLMGIGIPSGLKELGMKEQDLKTMAENAQKDACGLTNPRCPSFDDVISTYRAAL